MDKKHIAITELDQIKYLISKIGLLESNATLGTMTNPITIQYQNKPTSFFKMPGKFGDSWIEMDPNDTEQKTRAQWRSKEVENQDVIAALNTIESNPTQEPSDPSLLAHKQKVLTAFRTPTTTQGQSALTPSRTSTPTASPEYSTSLDTSIPSYSGDNNSEQVGTTNPFGDKQGEYSKWSDPKAVKPTKIVSPQQQSISSKQKAGPQMKSKSQTAQAVKPKTTTSNLSKSTQIFKQQAADSAAKWRAQAKQAAPGSLLQKQLQKNADIADKDALNLKEKIESLHHFINKLNEDEVSNLEKERDAYRTAGEQATAMYYQKDPNGNDQFGGYQFRQLANDNFKKADEKTRQIARIKAKQSTATPPVGGRAPLDAFVPTPQFSPNTQQPHSVADPFLPQQSEPNRVPNANVHTPLDMPQSSWDKKLGFDQPIQTTIGTSNSRSARVNTQPSSKGTVTRSNQQKNVRTTPITNITQQPNTTPTASQSTMPSSIQGAPVTDLSTPVKRQQPSKSQEPGDIFDPVYGNFAHGNQVGESINYSDETSLARIIGLAGLK